MTIICFPKVTTGGKVLHEYLRIHVHIFSEQKNNNTYNLLQKDYNDIIFYFHFDSNNKN